MPDINKWFSISERKNMWQGSYGSLNPWKVLEFCFESLRPWKVLENCIFAKSPWIVLEKFIFTFFFLFTVLKSSLFSCNVFFYLNCSFNISKIEYEYTKEWKTRNQWIFSLVSFFHIVSPIEKGTSLYYNRKSTNIHWI